jgi:hypothetical protein
LLFFPQRLHVIFLPQCGQYGDLTPAIGGFLQYEQRVSKVSHFSPSQV